MGEIHLDDVGTRFEVTIKDDGVVVDISAASVKEIIFKRQNGSLLTKSASFTTDGTDGRIDYTTVSGDLTQVGIWNIQAKITLGSGTWRSEVEEFEVFDNLN